MKNSTSRRKPLAKPALLLIALTGLAVTLSSAFGLSPWPSLTGKARASAPVHQPGLAATKDGGAAPSSQRHQLPRAMSEAFGQLPLSFIENRGQFDAPVAYYVQGRDTMLYFTPQGITFALSGHPLPPAVLGPPAPQSFLPPAAFSAAPRQEDALRQWALKLDFVGANPKVKPAGQDRTPAVISYFKGSPNHWRTGLKTYATLVYADLWPGVDLVYSGTVNRLKYEFVVKPGADPGQIKLAYRGATAVRLNPDGQIEVSTPAGGFHDDKPYAYQEAGGQRVEIATTYALTSAMGADVYGFRVSDYDRSKPLTLDPAMLVYSGFIGGAGDDAGNSIAVDDEGNVYVAGATGSSAPGFPNAAGAIGLRSTDNGGGSDVFVAKLNAAGTAMLYASYIGGKGKNLGQGIAVDAQGNAYVTGQTNARDFPTANSAQPVLRGGADAFVAKLNAPGSSLDYSTYLGGSGADEVHGIAVDNQGYVYLTGAAQATAPAAAGSFKASFGGGAHDAFAAKLNPKASGADSIVYYTYRGGGGDDEGRGIAVDSNGQAYVTGQTDSIDFPLSNPLQSALGGGSDAFVVKLDAAGASLVYATYLGVTTITWTAIDGAENMASCQQKAPVTNPSPMVTISGPLTGSVYAAGTPVNFTGAFTDNAGGAHTATWSFDAITQAGAVNEATGAVSATHTFNAPGVYQVTLTVNDGCGGVGTATTIGGFEALVVIFDPADGFVTGGGWFNSPMGAYPANPSLTGKANFGFVAKYHKDAVIPTGETEFQFKPANLNFHSTSYEWLVVTDARAQYKGSGTIKGSGNYGFMVTVIDGKTSGSADKFRIKIWDKNNGNAVVYDNQMGASDDADPTTVLGGGSIVIHK